MVRLARARHFPVLHATGRRLRFPRRESSHQELSAAEFIRLLDALHIASSGSADARQATASALRACERAWAAAAAAEVELMRNPWPGLSATAMDPSVRSGCEVFAAAWNSYTGQGASLAQLVSHVRRMCRIRAETDALVREETASLAMSARLLNGLPLLSLPLGALIGANPLSWLVASAAGRVVLTLGLALQAAAWWVSRTLIRRATRHDPTGTAVAACAAALGALAARPGAVPIDLARDSRSIAGMDPTGYLAAVADSLEVGASPQTAWLAAAHHRDAWGAVGEAMSQMSAAGSLAPELLISLSDDAAQRQRAQVRERVRRTAVLMLLPTGLLSLPAFMLLTVVPLVAGHFTQTTWLPSP